MQDFTHMYVRRAKILYFFTNIVKFNGAKL